MLSDAIGDLLPSALAVALSPISIVAVVVVLGAPRARTAGPAFAFGWIAGLLSVSVIVVLLVGTGGDGDSDDPGLNWLKIAIGVLFLLMAAKAWRKRPKRGEEPEAPSWMATIDTAAPAREALLGAALSGANPKNLALTLAAAASIAEAGLDGTDTAVAFAVFVVLGSVTGRRLGAVLPPRRGAGRAAARGRQADPSGLVQPRLLLPRGRLPVLRPSRRAAGRAAPRPTPRARCPSRAPSCPPAPQACG